jgi:chemotaxis protein CheD
MMKIIVSIADMKVTKNPEDTLITYSLGSCIGVTIYDPFVKVGGLLHFMLPDSQIDPQKAQKNPWMFADTGIPSLFKEAYKLGAEKERLEVKVVGGSQIMDGSGFFNIGKKNYSALQKIFRTNGVSVTAEDVGGNGNRTVTVEVSSGKVLVKSSVNEVREL